MAVFLSVKKRTLGVSLQMLHGGPYQIKHGTKEQCRSISWEGTWIVAAKFIRGGRNIYITTFSSVTGIAWEIKHKARGIGWCHIWLPAATLQIENNGYSLLVVDSTSECWVVSFKNKWELKPKWGAVKSFLSTWSDHPFSPAPKLPNNQ